MTISRVDAASWPLVAVVPLAAIDLIAITVSLEPTPAEQAAQYIDHEHDHHEHERCCPRQLDLVFERHAREVVDQHGQRSGRPHEADLAVLDQPVAAEERGEQEWGRLARG